MQVEEVVRKGASKTVYVNEVVALVASEEIRVVQYGIAKEPCSLG